MPRAEVAPLPGNGAPAHPRHDAGHGELEGPPPPSTHGPGGASRASRGRRSSLDEPIDDGTGEESDHRDRRVEIRAAEGVEAKPVGLCEARHRLPGPSEEMPLAVGNPEHVPDD